MTQDCNKLKLISAIFFFPIRSFLGRLGIHYDFSGIANGYYRKMFDSIPPSEKAVILPHCLIGDKCKGHFSKEDGIICVKCKNCRCCDIRRISEEQGWQFYITPSMGFTKRLVQRRNIGAAVGASCNLEIERGIRSTTISTRGVHLKKGKVIPQIILTSTCDCLHNDIDWKLLQQIIQGENGGHLNQTTK